MENKHLKNFARRMWKYYGKLSGSMVAAMAMAMCLFSSDGWCTGTPRGFTVDLSNAVFSSVPGNPLKVQSTGVAVSFAGPSRQAGYTVLWEFSYTDNKFHIVSATNTTSGGNTGGGTSSGGGTSGTTVTDVDGNVYNTVTIGTQTWMKENLKVTKYRDGTAIPTTTSMNISSETAPKYQWAYDGLESNVAAYGRLYTWYAATDSRGLCPSGWHLPTDAEWTTLTTYLGGEGVAGGHLKEAGTTHWRSPNTGADNSSGFTALPGGSRDDYGAFSGVGGGGDWWSATERSSTLAWYRVLYDNSGGASRTNFYKDYGFSVRCVGD